MWQIHDNQFDFSITYSIVAPKLVVYAVLANLEAYPEFISDLISASREGDTYRVVAKAAILTIPARVRVSEDPGREVTFELIEGPVDRLTGRWRIEDGDLPDHTKVTLSVHIEAGKRGEWLLRMAGKYVESKTSKLIDAFSRRVETVQRGEISPGRPAQVGLWARISAALRRFWMALTGKSVEKVWPAGVTASAVFQSTHQIETLEALAATLLPPDEFDDGVQGLGFPDVAEMRARYQAGRAEMYLTALRAVDQMAQAMFGKQAFVNLSPVERTQVLDAVRQGQVNTDLWGHIQPKKFFTALWEDIVFLYCTHPGTWGRIGWPGPSFDAGGYPDFDRKQTFMEQANENRL